MIYRSTLRVSRILGVTVGRLSRAVWDERIKAPQKGPGGAYIWTEKDIDRASWVLLHKSYEPAEGDENGNS